MDIVRYVRESVSLYFEKIDKNFKFIEKKVRWQEVLIFILCISILSYFIDLLINPQVDEFGLGLSVSVVITFFMILIIVPILLFFSYGALHLLLILFGGKGKFKETFKFGLSTSVFPSLIFLILGLIPVTFVESSVFGPLFSGLFLLTVFIIFIWSLIISAKVYSKVHKISFWKCIIAMLIPIFILLAIVAVFAAILMSFMLAI